MENNYETAIQRFFDYEIDKELQQRMLTDTCTEWADDTLSYIHSVLEIPIESFIEHIENIKRQPITAADIFQFSNFENATKNLCAKIVCSENAGLKFLEIGKLLFDDGISRTDTAFRKYGENHIKMAEAVGLAFKDGTAYYLSPIGCVYDKLADTEQSKLMIRLILRNKLISQLFSVALKGTFRLESFLYDIAESTYQRRKPNIKFVIDMLNASDEYAFLPITKNILF
ncbi:MAG: hypothetical protein J6V49_07690 [Bacteroidales bacterium]|nr:hypothetical protein [Bacteroidales bacterium]